MNVKKGEGRTNCGISTFTIKSSSTSSQNQEDFRQKSNNSYK